MFHQLWEDFNLNYPYFEHKQVMWDSIYDVYYQKFETESNEEDFFLQLSDMLSTLKDIHIHLNASNKSFQYQKRHLFESNPSHLSNYYLEKAELDNNRVLYSRIKGTQIAYLKIRTFEGSVNNYTVWPTETIVSSIAKKKGLIIDLRDNAGGKEDFAADFASRFVTDSRVYKQVRYRSGPDVTHFGQWTDEILVPASPIDFDYPIVILTNRGCYSATESFVLMMKTLTKVVMIGDTTGGATGNPSVSYLPNGWRYTLPTWQARDIQGKLIEDVGIAPDIPINMTESSISMKRDLILEKALEQF